ncbi:MAG: mechanosensitive ion channel family protein, partial [Massilia sp.]
LGATGPPFLLALSLLVALSQLTLPPQREKWLQYAWIVILVSQIGMWGARIIAVAATHAIARRREADPSAATHLMLGALVARLVLWTVLLLVMLDNLGFNIATLMASLGIGGIAVALAVQNILGDIFSSVSIAFDKPFVIGDFIVVDDYMGTVEYVGMKTTRLRSLGGEQIIISNSELLKNRIRNFKRMEERRVLFEFGIAYETGLAEVERIPAMVQDIVRRQQAVRLDRVHFKSHGDSALMFEVVYYVLDADFNRYMDIQQRINLDMLREFRAAGIAFAYPTTTVHVARRAPAAAAAAGAGAIRAVPLTSNP